jgi:hypothetical protein
MRKRQTKRESSTSDSDLVLGAKQDSVVAAESDERFSLSTLESSVLQQIEEAFARELSTFLTNEKDTRGDLFTRLEKAVNRKIDGRQFDSLLRRLHADQYLRIYPRRLFQWSAELKTRPGYSDLRSIAVVAGTSVENFEMAAAQELIERLHQIGKTKRESGEVLRVGIVSGRTTGAVIRKIAELRGWPNFFGIKLEDFPNRIHVFALNACLTVAQYLKNNATILAHQFADAINRETGREIAQAWGLSAPLFVERSQLPSIDRAPQTFEVVRYTEPYRVLQRILEIDPTMVNRKIEETTTDLDIILAGVGERPAPSKSDTPGSIFYSLAKEFGVDMATMEQRIVGDVAFTAIRPDGEPVALTRKTGDDVVDCMFYSAVQLPVFEAMAKDPNKSVILVARDTKKVAAIYASICGHRRYVSSLVVNEETARGLLHFM